jgi:hypothetical protein
MMFNPRVGWKLIEERVEGKKEDPTHRGGNRDDRQTKSLDDRGSDRNKE